MKINEDYYVKASHGYTDDSKRIHDSKRDCVDLIILNPSTIEVLYWLDDIVKRKKKNIFLSYTDQNKNYTQTKNDIYLYLKCKHIKY